MTGIIALDIIIGLSFIYLTYSLFATLVQEIIATNLGFRAKTLKLAIKRMLEDNPNLPSSRFKRFWYGLWERLREYSFLFFGLGKNFKVVNVAPANNTASTTTTTNNNNVPSLAKHFYDYPSIKYLAQDAWHSKPSYISSENFSKTIIDLLKGDQIKVGDDIRTRIENILFGNMGNESLEKLGLNDKSETLKYLKSLWLDSQGDIEKFKFLLEKWFDDTMERTKEWYKQHTQVILFIVGLGIAGIFNVNTPEIVTKLSKDPVLREQLVKQADTFVKEHPNLEQEYRLHKTQIKDNTDSLSKTITTADSLESLIKTRDELTKQASDMVKGDISKINNLLALGWPDIPDSLELKPIDSLSTVKKKAGYSYLQIDLANVKGRDSSMLVLYPSLLGVHVSDFLKLSCKTLEYKNFNNAHTKIEFQKGSYQWCFLWRSFSGWFITALAISLGAPFWFDLLNKLIKLRGAVKPQETKEQSTGNTVTPDKIHG